MPNKMPATILFLIGSIFLFGYFSSIAVAISSNLLISEIKVDGETSTDEFIELYNSSGNAMDLNGWKLYKFTKSNTSTDKLFLIADLSGRSVQAGGYFLAAHTDYQPVGGVMADIVYNENSLAPDNTVLLYDNGNNLVDLVGYGEATAFEGTAASSTTKTQSISRQAVDDLMTDTDNNAADFSRTPASPQNSSSGIELPPEEKTTPTSTPAVKIAINELVSDPAEGSKEWIELYNISTSSIDLTGWTLSDGVGVIFSSTSTILADEFFVIELPSNKLNNDGDIIILKNPERQIVDQITYGSWDDGNKNDNASAASTPNSIARIADGQDTDNDKNDFAETITPTGGAANQITAPAPKTTTPPSGSGSAGGSVYSPPTYNSGQILINELVADPSDNQEEFVELYNPANFSIDLNGWSVEDGSENQTSLAGIINSKGFFVIEKPKGNLNNNGDIVILFDPSGKEIDRVTYGTWDDGNLSDNAPAPADPFGLARKVDGQDSNNDYYDFVLTSTITKGRANKINVEGADGQASESVSGSSKIILNEIFPNPKGSDIADEFIELTNIGADAINLAGWMLSDSLESKYKITQGIIQPNEFIIFKRSMTGIALNNTGGDKVRLYLPNGGLADSVKYTGSAAEAETYVRRIDGTWAWSTEITSGKENVIKGKSSAPIIFLDAKTEAAVGEEIVFEASDTIDPEGEKMVFNWDFGDGSKESGDTAKHIFSKTGSYNVELTVADTAGNESRKKAIIEVKGFSAFTGGYYDIGIFENIKISEIFPNPEGSDDAEFIELFNAGNIDVDLSGFKLDDEESGSRAFIIPKNTIIKTRGFLVFKRKENGLALNNSGDSVRLLLPDGEIITEVDYGSAVEGASYALDENSKWAWTDEPTPGGQNNIRITNHTDVRITNMKIIKSVIEAALDKIRDLDKGDLVKTKGIAAVLPGVFSAQYFYIVNPAESLQQGVQIYMNKKDFPDLQVGDEIEVSGEISEAYGETRVKIREKTDIKKLGFSGEPEPSQMEISSIDESCEGALVEIEGEITEIKSSYMYIDDGSEEIKIYFKQGAKIDKKAVQLGDLVKVRGIVSQSKAIYQILPRSQQDIQKAGVAESAKEIQSSPGIKSDDTTEKYLTATAGGLTSILIGLFAKSRGRLMLAILKKIGSAAMAVFKRCLRV